MHKIIDSLKKSRRLEAGIIKIISGYTTVPQKEIKMDSRFVEDLGFASLDTMTMMSEIENKYRIRVENIDELYNIKTVKELIALVQSHIDEKK